LAFPWRRWPVVRKHPQRWKSGGRIDFERIWSQQSILFSPDGLRIVSGGDNTVRLWTYGGKHRNGRIDMFDTSNPVRPLKITEIEASANDGSFTPKFDGA
jgi:WD40 repeat protein